MFIKYSILFLKNKHHLYISWKLTGVNRSLSYLIKENLVINQYQLKILSLEISLIILNFKGLHYYFKFQYVGSHMSFLFNAHPYDLILTQSIEIYLLYKYLDFFNSVFQ